MLQQPAAKLPWSTTWSSWTRSRTPTGVRGTPVWPSRTGTDRRSASARFWNSDNRLLEYPSSRLVGLDPFFAGPFFRGLGFSGPFLPLPSSLATSSLAFSSLAFSCSVFSSLVFSSSVSNRRSRASEAFSVAMTTPSRVPTPRSPAGRRTSPAKTMPRSPTATKTPPAANTRWSAGAAKTRPRATSPRSSAGGSPAPRRHTKPSCSGTALDRSPGGPAPTVGPPGGAAPATVVTSELGRSFRPAPLTRVPTVEMNARELP